MFLKTGKQVCVCVYVYMYVYMYVCIYIYIYISGLKVNFSLSPLLTFVCFLFFQICWSLIGDFCWNLVTQCIFRLIGEQNGCNF